MLNAKQCQLFCDTYKLKEELSQKLKKVTDGNASSSRSTTTPPRSVVSRSLDAEDHCATASKARF